MLSWAEIDPAIRAGAVPTAFGRVTRVVGLIAEATLPGATIGGVVEMVGRDGLPVQAEIVGLGDGQATLMPVGDLHGVGVGSLVRPAAGEAFVPVGDAFLGRIVDALGQPLDGGEPIVTRRTATLQPQPINPLERVPIREPMAVGVRAIDGALCFGKGQRVALMAGSGVGKSTLLGMIARKSDADVNVIALVGERGREVRDFVEDVLGPDGLSRSVVVVATSDAPPLLRIRAALMATTLAEAFRADGRQVFLLVDSLTRVAMAQREVGLAAGEPPTTRGYTPSCFAMLPSLLERAGTASGDGAITGLYTVLVEGDDLQDPIGDAVRSIADGHIVLSRRLADRGQYPPIDVLRSVSRVMSAVVDDDHVDRARRLRGVLAAYEEAEDLVNLGAYVQGSNPDVDDALKRIGDVREFLTQTVGEPTSWDDTSARLAGIFEDSQS